MISATARRVLRLGAVAGLVLATLIGVAGTASAHDTLESTSPADGSTIAKVPSTVALTFNLPALAIGSVMQVVGPSGNVAVGKPTLIDDDVHQAVEPGAPAGHYTVEWRVTSADGHPISGRFSFTAKAKGDGTAPAGRAVSADPGPGSSRGTPSGSSKGLIIGLFVVIAGLVVGAGIFLTRTSSHPEPSESSDPDEDPAPADDQPVEETGEDDPHRTGDR